MRKVLKFTLVSLLLATLTQCQDEDWLDDDDRQLCLTQCAVDYWDCYWSTGNNRKCQNQQHVCVLRCPKKENDDESDTSDSSISSLNGLLNYAQKIFNSKGVEKYLKQE